jgi:response regulator NasT
MEVAARGLQSNACAVVTKPLSVLLIDDNPARAEIVEAGLAAAGYRLHARLEGTQDLIGRVRELEPDVVVVSIDSPSRDTIEDMRRTTDLLPRPIALFVDRSDPATIAAAMEAGVSAYVVKGLAQDRVRPVVDVAVAHFNRYHAMREELDRARLSLVERKTVERAKGLLMEQKGLSEEAAYKLLRKLAMDQILWNDALTDGVSLFEICDNDSQGLHEAHVILTDGHDSFRPDLEIEEITNHVMFLYGAVFHPSIHPFRQGILDNAFNLFGEESLALMWLDTSGLPESDLADIGFRKIAGEDLIFRHSALRTPFSDRNPLGQDADVEALPFPPRTLNSKPSRFGYLRGILDFYDHCADHDLIASIAGDVGAAGDDEPQAPQVVVVHARVGRVDRDLGAGVT